MMGFHLSAPNLVPLGSFLLLALIITTPHPDVTQANFDRIEKGMKKQEVEKIMGRPSTTPIVFRFNEMTITRVEWIGTNRDGNEVLIVIEFDGQGTVYSNRRDIVVRPLPERLTSYFWRIGF